jgi:ABC-type bacteriocin/lantibiotic exporter with double-glycine peptidase domain
MARRVPVVLQMTLGDCGAACLTAVLRYHGDPAELAEVRERTGAGRGGLTARRICVAARGYGLRARGYALDPATLAQLPLPAVAHWEGAHFVVLERVGERSAVVMDPALGRRVLTVAELHEGLGRAAVALAPGPGWRPRPRAPRPALPAVLRTAVVTHRGLLLAVLTASLVLQVLGLALPLATAVVVNRVLAPHDPGPLGAVGAGMVALLATQLLVARLRTALLVGLQQRVDAALMSGVLRHLLALPLRWFQDRSGGDLMNRVANTGVLRELVTTQTVAAVLDAAFMTAYLVVMLVVAPGLGLVVCAIGAAQLAVLLCAHAPARRLRHRHLLAQSRSQTELFQALAGIATVKATGSEERVQRAWERRFAVENGCHARLARLDATVEDLTGALRTLAPLVLIWLGAQQVLDGALDLGALLALQALAIAFLMPLAGVIADLQRLQLAAAHLTRLRDLLDARPEPATGTAPPPPTGRVEGRIEARSVGYAYDPDGPPVLRDVTLTVEPGQKVAIVGPSGSGKSTLGHLLLGLLQPDAGEIRYDGVPGAQLGPRQVRRRFGAVLQEPFVFGESIRRNIDGDSPAGAAEHAARTACLDDDIARMPMGYDTQLGDNGAGLSGGQRQRLALARAVAAGPPVLLLDEATSHLDTRTEQRIAANLDALSCTRIVIAHRLSTVRDADLIIVLDGGVVVERGRHDELVERAGLYAALVERDATSRSRVVGRPPSRPRSGPDALDQGGQARPAELAVDAPPAGHRQDQRLARPLDDRAVPAAPADVGRDQGEPPDALLRPDRPGGRPELQRLAQPVLGDLPRQPERSPDVLLVDQAVGERDPAAEAGGEPARALVRPGHGDQLLGGVAGVRGHAEVVRAPRAQPGAQHAADQPGPGQLVVAEHVGDHLAHGPLAAQRGRLPLLVAEPLEQVDEVGALGGGQVHGVDGGAHARSTDTVVVKLSSSSCQLPPPWMVSRMACPPSMRSK